MSDDIRTKILQNVINNSDYKLYEAKCSTYIWAHNTVLSVRFYTELM